MPLLSLLFLWRIRMSEIKPSTFVVENAPWSISKADVAALCPHKFYLQYIKKVKLEGLAPNVDALIGKAVHRALEFAITGRPLAQCLQFAIDEFKLTTHEIDRVMSFELAATHFVDRFESYRRRHDCAEPVTEQRLAIDFDGNSVDFFNNKGLLRGVIDVYTCLKTKPYALIIDHKTGKEQDLHYYENQFNAYTLLLKAKIPTIMGVIVGINFLQEDAIELRENGKITPVQDITPFMENIIRYLNKATETTHNHTICKTGPLCGWCDYREICPAMGANHGRKVE